MCFRQIEAIDFMFSPFSFSHESYVSVIYLRFMTPYFQRKRASHFFEFVSGSVDRDCKENIMHFDRNVQNVDINRFAAIAIYLVSRVSDA